MNPNNTQQTDTRPAALIEAVARQTAERAAMLGALTELNPTGRKALRAVVL